MAVTAAKLRPVPRLDPPPHTRGNQVGQQDPYSNTQNPTERDRGPDPRDTSPPTQPPTECIFCATLKLSQAFPQQKAHILLLSKPFSTTHAPAPQKVAFPSSLLYLLVNKHSFPKTRSPPASSWDHLSRLSWQSYKMDPGQNGLQGYSCHQTQTGLSDSSLSTDWLLQTFLHLSRACRRK